MIRVVRWRTADDSIWDHYQRNSANATFYHGRVWAEIQQKFSGFRLDSHAWLLEFSDGLEAVLPCLREEGARGLLSRSFCSVWGTYGGMISLRPFQSEHQNALLRFLVEHLGTLQWRLNPLDPPLTDPAGSPGRADRTWMLDLRNGYECLRQLWSRTGQWRKIKKACRAGLTVTAVTDEGAWKEYDDLYRRSLRRWGEEATMAYPPRLFELLSQLRNPDVQLWLVRAGEEAVAGAICLHGPRHVSYWQGAHDERFSHLRPVNLLFDRCIAEACRQRRHWFDFNPSGGLHGVERFKRSFSSQPFSTPLLCRQSTFTRVVTDLMRWRRRIFTRSLPGKGS